MNWTGEILAASRSGHKLKFSLRLQFGKKIFDLPGGQINGPHQRGEYFSLLFLPGTLLSHSLEPLKGFLS